MSCFVPGGQAGQGTGRLQGRAGVALAAMRSGEVVLLRLPSPSRAGVKVLLQVAQWSLGRGRACQGRGLG